MKYCSRLLTLLLALSPLAAAAAPVDPAGLVPSTVRRALLVPRAGPGAIEAAAVLTVAGAKAPMLRPGNLSRTLAQTVAIEPFDPTRLAEAGVDPDGPLAVAWFTGVEAAVAGVKDPSAAQVALAGWLAQIGGGDEVRRRAGAELHLHVSGRSVLAGWTIWKGRLYAARATELSGDVEAALLALLAAKGGKGTLAADALWPGVRDAAGPVKLFVRGAGDAPIFVSLGSDGADGLVIAGAMALSAGIPAPGSTPAGFEAVTAEGSLATLRLSLPRDALAAGGPLRALTRTLTTRACATCTDADADALATALAPLLDGRAVAVVSTLQVIELSLAGRLTDAALPHLWLLGARDAGQVAALLAPLAARGGFTRSEGGWARRELRFGAADGVLWVGTDAALVLPLRAKAALDPARSGAPLELTVSPPALARALETLDLGDALGGGVLAGLFALKVELGGFLQQAGPLSLTAQPGKGHLAFRGRWDLQN